IVVPEGNPGGVTGLADFAMDDLFIGLCADGVPCGVLARELLANAGVEPVVDTDEPDVRSLLTKVPERELGGGGGYGTDVVAAGGVEGIGVPPEHRVETTYPIGVLGEAPNRNGAGKFVACVMSEAGRSILSSFGFAAP